MPWTNLLARARRDPFAFSLFNALRDNQAENEALHLIEHDPAGRHNALEVARGVAFVQCIGTTYSLPVRTTDAVLSVSRAAVGVVDVSLSGVLASGPLGVRLTVIDDGETPLPRLATYERTPGGVRVRLYRLASAGNAWAAVDAPFYLGVHAQPYTPGAVPISTPPPVRRGDTLGFESWNDLITAQPQLRQRLLAEHRDDGQHNALEIARAWVRAQYQGIDYVPLADEGAGVSRISTGHVRVMCGDAETDKRPPIVFHQADYARASTGTAADITVLNVVAGSFFADGFSVRLWRHDPVSRLWALTDFDFAVSVHWRD